MAQPFSIFPTDLLAHDLSALELRVLIALYSFRGKNTNTVWPSLDSLSEVSGIADKTTVSKVTTRLSEKGLLTKKKRGFTGGNSYDLLVPELDASSNLDKTSNMDKLTIVKISNLDKSSNLEKASKPNLDDSSNSNLDESSKSKEVTIEVTNEVLEIGSPQEKNTSVAIAPANKKTATRLPEQWALPKDWANWALGRGLSKETVLLEAEKFHNCWIAKSGKDATKLNWRATWRNWVIRSIEQSGNKKTFFEKTCEAKERAADKRLTGLSSATPEDLKQLGLA